MCNGLFDGKRNAVYCSARCRKRASRKSIAKGTNSQVIYDLIRNQLFTLAGMSKQNTIKSLVLIALELLDESNKRKIYNMLKDYQWEIRE